MKILIVAICPIFLPNNIKYMLNSWVNALKNTSDIEVATLVSENLLHMDKESKHVETLNTISFIFDPYATETIQLLAEEKLITAKNISSILWNISKDNLNEVEENKYSQILKEKTSHFIPDIIISYHSGTNLLQKTFPNTLLLFMENGIFSRAPFPHTLYLSPYSSKWHAYITKYKDDIYKIKMSEDEEQKLRETKKKIVDCIENQSPIKNELISLKKKFRKLLLLPLASGGSHTESKFTNELELLHYVLEKTPKDMAIILTKHDSFKGEPSPQYLKKLQEKHPNLIFFDYLNSLQFASSSLFFLPHIDAIFGLYSGVALMSLLWDVPIISMVNCMHDAYKEREEFENIEEIFKNEYKEKNLFLYWYLTHYVLFMQRMNDSQWISQYFNEKLLYFKEKGSDFSYFNKKEDIFELCDFLYEYVSEYYLQCSHKDEILLKTYLKDQDIEGLQSLHFAVIRGNLAEVQSILSKSKDINIKTKNMRTALHFAAEYGHDKILHLLLKNKAYINSRDVEGKTPLYIAVEKNNLEAVQILLEKNANKNIKTTQSLTALEIALKLEYKEIIKLLK